MNMKFNKETWERIKSLLTMRADSLSWEKKYFPLSLDEIRNLKDVHVEVKLEKVTTSYLDFLREQIGLNARGKEWSAILQRRLDALLPFENRETVTFNLSVKEGWLIADFPPTLDRVLRVESEEKTRNQPTGQP